MTNKIEKRTFDCELRAMDDDSGSKIVGYAAVFDSRSQNLGGFVEVIAPGAFDDALSDDVRGLFNHDSNFILGRTTSGTLAISVDSRGLKYEITPPTTQTIKDLVIEPMKRGDITQSSFGFRVAPNGDTWDEDENGVLVRTITKIGKLFDVSPVTYPAYTDTDVATRSLDEWKKQQEPKLDKEAKQKRSRELDLLRI